MKFYTNSLQCSHQTISQLESVERLEDILKYLQDRDLLNIIESSDYLNLLTSLPEKDKRYILTILEKLRDMKFNNCKYCSWYNTIQNDQTQIECEMCGLDITDISHRYSYLCEEFNDTSIHHNTVSILENMLSCINNSLITNTVNDKINEDIMFVTRPPGHHSSEDITSGFCYLNWTYLISQYLINKLSNKVCVIDLDLHHGNGTQKMLEGDNDTLFLDFHYYDGIFYPQTGNEMDDTSKYY